MEAFMPYRVLALAGGGVWAVIQVKALIRLYNEDTTGHQVLQDFDLVAGTSGGGIVLGGLVENVTLGALLNFFADEANRRAIFSPTPNVEDEAIAHSLHAAPKYSAPAKLAAFQHLLPNRGGVPLPTAVAGVSRTAADKEVHLLI